jgi:hypothetical protein
MKPRGLSQSPQNLAGQPSSDPLRINATQFREVALTAYRQSAQTKYVLFKLKQLSINNAIVHTHTHTQVPISLAPDKVKRWKS